MLSFLHRIFRYLLFDHRLLCSIIWAIMLLNSDANPCICLISFTPYHCILLFQIEVISVISYSPFSMQHNNFKPKRFRKRNWNWNHFPAAAHSEKTRVELSRQESHLSRRQSSVAWGHVLDAVLYRHFQHQFAAIRWCASRRMRQHLQQLELNFINF